MGPIDNEMRLYIFLLSIDKWSCQRSDLATKSWDKAVLCPIICLILHAEVFSNMLIWAEKMQLIQGLRFRRELSITHLLFAKDSLIFTRAATKDYSNLKEIFYCYSAASGQIFNCEKSSMFFSGNTKPEQISTIKKFVSALSCLKTWEALRIAFNDG